jgi:hypothetical protein
VLDFYVHADLAMRGGESRPDTDIVFQLACRPGLGGRFSHGDVGAGYRHQLGRPA